MAFGGDAMSSVNICKTCLYEVLSESPRAVIVVTASVKEDNGGG
jgi:hypothetical protein